MINSEQLSPCVVCRTVPGIQTNTIPPCPACGTVPPEGRFWNLHTILTGCEHVDGRRQTSEEWESACNEYLGCALRTHGIHTIQQLTERLDLLTQYRVNNDAQIRRIAELESVAPDPRVAVLDWVENLLDAPIPTPAGMAYATHIAVETERARLRALIAAERKKL